MQKIDPSLFDWQIYRRGTLLDLECFNRYWSIKENLKKIKKHVVGYCRGENLLCRPKKNQIAVMFFINGYHFWTHFPINEFQLLKGK